MDLQRAQQVKGIIEAGTISGVIMYAQKAFPKECCGFILENGAIIPAQNVIENLYDKSLTSENAFLIDDESWRIASTNVNPIMCVYHSHTNGDPNMSGMDRYTLRWSGLCYLIIGLVDTNPIAAKLFWWSGEDLNELDIKL